MFPSTLARRRTIPAFSVPPAPRPPSGWGDDLGRPELTHGPWLGQYRRIRRQQVDKMSRTNQLMVAIDSRFALWFGESQLQP
jgi:hypothetical protein